MKPYFESGEAAWNASNSALSEYPSYHQQILAHVTLPPEAEYKIGSKSFRTDIDPPAPLIVRAMQELQTVDRSKTRVLDLGCGTASQGLFLAANGYRVTAMDTNANSLEIAHQTARSLGITPRNFEVKRGDALRLPTTEKYDVVIAGMLLHFFKKEDNRSIVRQMKSLTLPNGMNLLSAYTTDNPEEETLRGRQYLFEKNELASLYAENGWQKISYVERFGHRPQARSFTKFIVPTIAELIARKSSQMSDIGRTALGQDLAYWRRTDPEYYDLLLEMSGQ